MRLQLAEKMKGYLFNRNMKMYTDTRTPEKRTQTSTKFRIHR